MNKIRKILIENTMYEDGAFAIVQMEQQIFYIISELLPDCDNCPFETKIRFFEMDCNSCKVVKGYIEKQIEKMKEGE